MTRKLVEIQSLCEAGKRSSSSKGEAWLGSQEGSMKAFAETDQQPSSSCPRRPLGVSWKASDRSGSNSLFHKRVFSDLSPDNFKARTNLGSHPTCRFWEYSGGIVFEFLNPHIKTGKGKPKSLTHLQ